MSIRRLSISSSGSSSPVLSSLDSSSALILVHDDDDNTHYDDDDDDDTDAPFEIGRPFVQSLEPSVVLLYLLSPFLKLGATLLPYTKLPLKSGLRPFFCSRFWRRSRGGYGTCSRGIHGKAMLRILFWTRLRGDGGGGRSGSAVCCEVLYGEAPVRSELGLLLCISVVGFY